MLGHLAQHLVEFGGVFQKGLVLTTLELKEEGAQVVRHLHLAIEGPLFVQALQQNVEAGLGLQLLEIQVLVDSTLSAASVLQP